MKTLVGKFSFKVPETHAEAGKKIEKPFEYGECENDTEAARVMTHDSDGNERKEPWKLLDMVNEALKSNARSNAYQAALLPYRPVTSTVTPEDIKERIIRDYIRSGIAEDVARAQVTALLSATSGQ